MFTLPPIGHSLGWLAAKVSPELRVLSEALTHSEGDAAELVCGDQERNLQMLCGNLVATSRQPIVSIHLPVFSDVSRSKQELTLEGEKLKIFYDHHHASHTALHPDQLSEETLAWLMKLGIPIAIENMDRLKPRMKTSEEVMKLCEKFKIPLVLDLQHAYENSLDIYGHGKEMEVAIELATRAKIGSGLSHLHVSGEIIIEGRQVVRHASLLEATNQSLIVNTLRSIQKIFNGHLPPIILEGDYLPDVSFGVKGFQDQRRLVNIAGERMRLEREWLMKQLRVDSNNVFLMNRMEKFKREGHEVREVGIVLGPNFH